MRGYWIKIVLGAVLVFAVGYGGVRLVRGAITHGHTVLETSQPISIPLAFIPFTLDGEKVGTFQGVTIRRDEPKVVAGIDIRVRLNDEMAGRDFGRCRITTVDRNDFDIEKGFTCLSGAPEDSALMDFGTIRFRGPGDIEIEVPFLLDSAAVYELRHSESGISVTREVIAEEEAARVAEEAAVAARKHADSIAAAVKARKAPRPPTPPPGT